MCRCESVLCVWTQDELQSWSRAMEQAVQGPPAEEAAPGPSGAKTHSLPAPTSSAALPEPSAAKKDKEKKFSRFAKKKWTESAGDWALPRQPGMRKKLLCTITYITCFLYI